MAKEIKTSIIIDADKEKVWQILTDFEKFEDWNPFITSLTGSVKVGNQINIVLSSMAFKPKVLVYNKNEEIKWLGYLFIKGLFDGEHQFKLTGIDKGKTLFEHNETFKGLLVNILPNKMYEETKEGFISMNEALKTRAEKKA